MLLQFLFGLAPRINACGRMGYQLEAFKLFLTDNIMEAKEITRNLNKYNTERQEKEKEIFEQILKTLEKEDMDNLNSIVLAGEGWHHGVIGIVASKITERFFKPTILIGFEEKEGKGSGRSIPGFDLHKALEDSKKYLDKYGGHEMAVGLSLERKNFDEFKNYFENLAKEKNVKQIIPVIKIDRQITKADFKKETINELSKLEPFGEKNRTPLFIYKNLKIDSIRALSEGKHLKLILKDDNYFIDAIGFNLGYFTNELLIGDKIDVVGTLELNTYNGIEKVQINIKDIMKSI